MINGQNRENIIFTTTTTNNQSRHRTISTKHYRLPRPPATTNQLTTKRQPQPQGPRAWDRCPRTLGPGPGASPRPFLESCPLWDILSSCRARAGWGFLSRGSPKNCRRKCSPTNRFRRPDPEDFGAGNSALIASASSNFASTLHPWPDREAPLLDDASTFRRLRGQSLIRGRDAPHP